MSSGVVARNGNLAGGEAAMATTVETRSTSVGPRTGKANGEWREVAGALLREWQRGLQGPPEAHGGCPDPVDEAREREEEAVRLAILDRSHDVQATVEEALRRLATGEYGRCMKCGQHIALARLRALPFAVRCLSCQERIEREKEASGHRSASRGSLGSRYDEHLSDFDRQISTAP